MKYWQEYYLAKHKREHFGRINIGKLDKIISYVLKFVAWSYFNVRVLPKWCSRYEAKTPL